MRGTIGASALVAGAALVVAGLSQPPYASLWDWSPVPFGGRFVHLYRPVLRASALLLGAARLVALGAAGLLSGAVWVVVDVVAAAARAPGEFRFTLGAGSPVLVFACLVALVGAVFGQTLVREQRERSVVVPECEANSRLSQPVERGKCGTAER